MLATPEGKAAAGGEAQGAVRYYKNAWLALSENGTIAALGEGEVPAEHGCGSPSQPLRVASGRARHHQFHPDTWRPEGSDS